MKVCFFSGDITRSGGTERVSIMIANELKRQGNHEILFLSLCEQNPRLQFELAEGIPHFALGEKWINPGPGYLKILPRLKKFFQAHQVDVVVDIDIVLDVLSVPVRGRSGVKVISWEHFNYQLEMQTFYRKVILHCFTKRADSIVTLTRRDAEAFQKKLKRAKGIRGIHNPMQARKLPVLEVRKKQIVTVGSLIPRKGTDMLARMAKAALKENPDWKWLVAGDGELREFLQNFVKEQKLEEQVLLLGNVKDVDALLAESSIFALTARAEGLPMCLLEAKAYGLPIVSFDIETGPDEIVRDGVNGYLIKPFEEEEMVQKLKLLMQDGEMRRKFSENAPLDQEKFRMDAIIAQWNECLEELKG